MRKPKSGGGQPKLTNSERGAKRGKAEGRGKNAEAKTWRETAETHTPRKGVGKRVESWM
jgi:hypothetical protein